MMMGGERALGRNRRCSVSPLVSPGSSPSDCRSPQPQPQTKPKAPIWDIPADRSEASRTKPPTLTQRRPIVCCLFRLAGPGACHKLSWGVVMETRTGVHEGGKERNETLTSSHNPPSLRPSPLGTAVWAYAFISHDMRP